MAKGGCVGEQLVTSSYGSPVPLIGLYIVAATLVCFFCMTFDLVYGFIRKKPFLPCKLFPMNAFTMTMVAIATKIPVDLTTPMPRAEDQLSKLTGTALLCTSLGFYLPSLGTMGTSERYGNLAALSVMVITVVANVCIQMGTGVIFAFTTEHIIIMVCILVLLVLMWSSAIAFRAQKEPWKPIYNDLIKDLKHEKGVQGLRKLLVKLHIINYTGNPQTLLCEIAHNHTFGLVCALSSAVVLEAMLRSFALKTVRLYCGSGVSDYKWSIPILIVAQFLTIAVGNFSIIFRWLSFVIHTDGSVVYLRPELELEFLKLKAFSFRFFHRKLSNVFLVSKNFILDVLIRTQIMLFICSGFLWSPIAIVKILFLGETYEHIFDEESRDIKEMLKEMSTSHSEIERFVFVCVEFNPYNTWMSKMAMRDMMRWRNTYKRDCPTHLIQLIPNCPAFASKSECAFSFIRKLEATGKGYLKRSIASDYEYKVSCVSVLVLSAMLAELLPSSSHKESLMQSLKESFEIIYYVDQKTTHTPSEYDQIKWMVAKDVWAQWENPNHWFQAEIISRAFKKKSKDSDLEQHDALGVLREAFDAAENFYGDVTDLRIDISSGTPFAMKHKTFIAIEFSIICQFIVQELECEPDMDVFDFLAKGFVEMLCFTLPGLPLAILKEIDGDDPIEIGEGRVKTALKFLCKLELLGDKVEWSWPAKFDPKTQANVVHSNSPVVAPAACVSEVEARISNVVEGKVGNSDASLAVVEEEDDDTIREI
ncbi:uncharacterized protein LOC122059639 [Macadamia integrifolia]|uniref:uncharacterized protein LOC122059639 n=1 Tax=Macadamia integrifolia TaxID=60698 RepID=UPI001C528EA7|nr:uncharacterized protein LOC122059639 [Macadamia integrifolia]XP_042478491.1 uncharacterized protein LOC122059639 [Macadamia integrifolia]